MQAVASSNTIHPTAVIGGKVRLGSGNVIGAFAVIDGDVEIGDGNWIGPHVTIGTPAQFMTTKFELNGEVRSGIRIGSRCVIREYCTVHQPSKTETVIEDDCYFMAYCHVSHDTVIRRGVSMANNTQIGGHTEIQQYATVGLSVVIHQFSTIGAYAMIGMASVITKDVPPFVKVVGNPARFGGVNEIGLSRSGFSAEAIAEIVCAYAELRLPASSDSAVQNAVDAFNARREAGHRGCMHIKG
jgi:UDP-N-acetylglucosamine acyltransferase